MVLLERYLDGMTMRQTLVTRNIANVDTPGYSRQVADLVETPPVEIGNTIFGTGVELSSVTSLRDAVLDLRVNQESQQQGQLNAFIGAGQQIQTLFNETTGSGLQAPLTAFFTSLSQLSSTPSDLNARQGVLTAAQNLATAFNQTSSSLTTIQKNEDLSVTQSVDQINSLTSHRYGERPGGPGVRQRPERWRIHRSTAIADQLTL